MSLVTAFLAGTAVPAAAPRSARPSAGFFGVGGGCALSVECSSRPQKKGTKHHMKTRPKKTQQWDIKRRPTQYPPLPALPEDWTLVAAGETAPEEEEEAAPAAATPVEVEVVAAPAAAD
jgi:50S ribosomal protein 6